MSAESATAADRIRWTVDVAQLELDRLRAGDWLNLRDDVRRYCEGAALAEVDLPPIPRGDDFRDVAARFQRAARALLDDIVATRKGSSTETTAVRLDFRYAVSDSKLVPRISVELVDLMVLLLVSAFDTEPLDRVRRCPECGRLFARVRRQTHCSRECINRSTSRRYRERTAVPGSRTKSSETSRPRLAKGQVGHASRGGPAPED
jgi:hypothetical protein